MSAVPATAETVLGTRQTHKLRDGASIEDAARQFEGLMLGEMMRAMRATIPKPADGSSVFARQTLDGLFDQAITDGAAGGLGIADILVRQLGGTSSPAPTAGLRHTHRTPHPLPSLAATERRTSVGGASAASDLGPRGELPVAGVVSSPFGMRVHPISGEQKFHAGLDVAAPEGTEIYAPAAGRVVFAGRRGGYGLTVELEHADGTRTRYAHASRIHVRVGDRIEAGEAIADVGTTGHSTGPHLHLEVRKDGQLKDPQRYLEQLSQQPSPAQNALRPRAGVVRAAYSAPTAQENSP